MWAIIPLKNLDRGKERLKGILSLQDRKQLSIAMLRDQLAVLKSIPAIEKIVLLSQDPYCIQLAAESGVCCLSLEEDTNLNTGLTAAVDHCQQQGAHQVMLLHGDIPLLNKTAIHQLIEAHTDNTGITLVPSNKKDGTNVLVADLPLTLQLQYGENSFSKHRQAAQLEGMKVNIHEDSSLGLDIDTETEFFSLLESDDTQANCQAFLDHYRQQVSRPHAAHS